MTLNPLFASQETLGINTDLYELTMAAAYFEQGLAEKKATFELFTRDLPENRNFFIAAGLEQALHYILHARFSDSAVEFLQNLDTFQHVSREFFDYLRGFQFSGDVHGLPEGTLFFENEPVLQVTAPIIEAQVLETFLINIINVQSMVASKAARLTLAARGRAVADFGSRRAHGPQTGILAARAAYIGGLSGTSNVLAGFEMGIPLYGTMAHSFIQFFDEEFDAFQAFYRSFPENSILLVDTYDTLDGVRKALELGKPIQGVRLDSGDLADLAIKTRALLIEQGMEDVQIVASGSLDEETLLAWSLQEIPIDAYGVGTELVTSRDAPTCDLVYKLVESFQNGQAIPRFKASQGKVTYPFRKQIFRRKDESGLAGDIIGKWDEDPSDAGAAVQPLLQPYLEEGSLIRELPDIESVREWVQKQLAELPTAYKHLHTRELYPVSFSQELERAREKLEQQYL